MKLLFQAMYQYLIGALASQRVSFIRVWDDQLNDLLNGENVEFALFDDTGATPPVFIEFPTVIEWNQIGNGVQIVDNLEITLHILHGFFDAQDGTFEQDLDVLAIAQAIFFQFEDWMPGYMTINGVSQPIPVGVITRVGDIQDTKHENVYHFQQKYTTTWVDSSKMKPVGGILSSLGVKPSTLVIQGTQSQSQYYYL